MPIFRHPVIPDIKLATNAEKHDRYLVFPLFPRDKRKTLYDYKTTLQPFASVKRLSAKRKFPYQTQTVGVLKLHKKVTK